METEAQVMQPTIGRILHYILSEADARSIQSRRSSREESGNPAREGDIVPMIVSATFPGDGAGGVLVNGQAFLDGTDSLWVTSAKNGQAPGCWFWPPRV